MQVMELLAGGAASDSAETRGACSEALQVLQASVQKRSAERQQQPMASSAA